MPSTDPTPRASRPDHELDGVVVNIELTVISIVQGMALSFLIDGFRTVFVAHRVEALPYLVTSLLVVFSVWSRAVLHALTVLRWPLDYGRNFFYFTIALFEGLLFSQAGAPAHWYPLGALLIVVFWLMFFYERRTYRQRMTDSAGPAGKALLETLLREHELNVRGLVPLTLVAWGGAAAALAYAPDLFVARGWHVLLGTLQALGMLGYLFHVLRFYRALDAPIVAARREWSGR